MGSFLKFVVGCLVAKKCVGVRFKKGLYSRSSKQSTGVSPRVSCQPLMKLEK